MPLTKRATLILIAFFIALATLFPIAEPYAKAIEGDPPTDSEVEPPAIPDEPDPTPVPPTPPTPPTPPVVNQPKPCSGLATSILGNIPKGAGGTVAQQYIYINKLNCAINAVPAGQPIYFSTYSLDVPSVADALIAAHNRGVAVKLTVWNERAYFPQTQRIIQALGTNITARSYVKVCMGSCLRNGSDGLQHAKAVAIPKLLGPGGKYITNITFVGSANPTRTNTESNWNTTRLFVGDAKIYVAMARYIYAQRLDRTQSLPTSVSSGSSTIYFSPGKLKDDAVLKALKATKCKAPKGYGLKGKTVIRIAMYEWSTGRKVAATQLAKLKKQGCDIRVILNDFKNPSHKVIVGILTKAKIPVEDGWVDANGDGKTEITMHEKTILISGKVNGKGQNLSYFGSRNWTNNGVDTNTELLVLDRQKSTMTYMLSRWNYELTKTQALKRQML